MSLNIIYHPSSVTANAKKIRKEGWVNKEVHLNYELYLIENINKVLLTRTILLMKLPFDIVNQSLIRTIEGN